MSQRLQGTGGENAFIMTALMPAARPSQQVCGRNFPGSEVYACTRPWHPYQTPHVQHDETGLAEVTWMPVQL